MKKRISGAAVSTLQVLEVISDEVSLDIFNTIGKNAETSENIGEILDISRKQYHARSSKLLKLGLVERKGGKYSLSSLGKLVYEAQLKIARAAHHSWKLKVIDSIVLCKEIPDNEHRYVIDKLIDDSEIKRLLFFKLSDEFAPEI
jgi:hypothetical protein